MKAHLKTISIFALVAGAIVAWVLGVAKTEGELRKVIAFAPFLFMVACFLLVVVASLYVACVDHFKTREAQRKNKRLGGEEESI